MVQDTWEMLFGENAGVWQGCSSLLPYLSCLLNANMEPRGELISGAEMGVLGHVPSSSAILFPVLLQQVCTVGTPALPKRANPKCHRCRHKCYSCRNIKSCSKQPEYSWPVFTWTLQRFLQYSRMLRSHRSCRYYWVHRYMQTRYLSSHLSGVQIRFS